MFWLAYTYCDYPCSDRLLQITMWGEHATSFEDQILIETIDKDEPVVMVFAGVQVKQYLGACYLSYPFHVSSALRPVPIITCLAHCQRRCHNMCER